MKLKTTTPILLSALMLLMACSEQQAPEAEVEEVIRRVNVRTEAIEPSEFASYLRLVGTVETSDDIQIYAEVSGELEDYFINEGDRVTKDQVIAKIDDTKLLQTKAQLVAATEQAKENYERLKKIYEEENIGSEINYLNAKYAYEQSQAQLNSIEVDLGATEVKAPFAGKVETFIVEEGEIAIPGSPLVRLIGSEKFVLSAGVPARYADVVRVNDEVDIWFDTQNSDTLSGVISYVANSINTQNRTFKIEVVLPKNRFAYKVDMVANLRLQTFSDEDVVVISEEFVYREDDGYIVYVSGKDDQGNDVALKKEVTLGPSYRTRVIIESGLTVGDELITIGSAFLNEGMRIQIFDDNANAVASQQ